MTAEMVQVWTAALDVAGEGLDLSDPDDRAVYRQRVRDLSGMAKLTAINEVIAALGGTTQAGRHTATRELARLGIERLTP